MDPSGQPFRSSGVLALLPFLLLLLTLLLLAPQSLVHVYAQTYTMTLQTDQPSYAATQTIQITGTVSPAPGAGTAVFISIRNPAGTVATVNEFQVLDNGSFSGTSVTGGSSLWSSGTYSLNATWGGNGASASKVVTFTYSSVATSTTASTSATAGSGSGSKTATTTSPIPEFPSGALAFVVLVGAAFVAVISRRAAVGPGPRAAVHELSPSSETADEEARRRFK